MPRTRSSLFDMHSHPRTSEGRPVRLPPTIDIITSTTIMLSTASLPPPSSSPSPLPQYNQHTSVAILARVRGTGPAGSAAGPHQRSRCLLERGFARAPTPPTVVGLFLRAALGPTAGASRPPRRRSSRRPSPSVSPRLAAASSALRGHSQTGRQDLPAATAAASSLQRRSGRKTSSTKTAPP